MIKFKILTKKAKLVLLFTTFFSFGSIYAQEKDINKSDSNIVTLINKNDFHSVSKTIKVTSKKSITKTAKSTADTEPPTLICPPDQKLNCGMPVPSYFDLLTVNDNIDTEIDVTQYPGEGSFFYDGMEIQFTAADDAGNISHCSIIVTAVTPDVTPPTFTCPSSIKLNCGDVIPNYAISPMMNLHDDCSINLKYKMTPAAGTIFYGIPTPVEIEYSDKTGNKSYCNFIITANPDVTKPIISCPSNKKLALGSVLPNYVSEVTVSDNCDASPVVTQSPVAGTAFIPGMTVTMTAIDNSGNSEICAFTVEAITSLDSEPPVISCPVNQELFANSTLPNYVSFLANITDNVTDPFDLIFTQTPSQGTLFTSDTNVKITATDEAGNSSSCTFLVKLKTSTEEINCKTTSFNVSNLNGSNGFTVFGDTKVRESGFSVNTTGDINNDGIDDFIIGAPGNYNPWYGKDKIYKIIRGAAFVVFGKTTGFPPNIDLGLLDGTNGFSIRNDIPSSNFPETGYDVSSAGDINGDGIDDFMISDPTRQSAYGPEVGHVYFIFGKNGGFPADFNLSTLNGTNGFTLIGNDNYGNVGNAITPVGDVNGDGFQDIAVITRGSGAGNGKCIIIYGKNGSFPAIIRVNDIDGTNGFIITGDAIIGKIGKNLSALGDVNGDNIPDIGLGCNDSSQSKLFVVFGRSANFPAVFNISQINGTNGFVVENSETPLYSYAGMAKAGDINGDGINDIFVTSNYILFGRTAFPKTVDLEDLNGSNGFKVTNYFGNNFGYAGDFNGDGIDDCFFDTGILYGKNTWNSTVNLNSISNNEFLKLNIPNIYSHKTAINFAGDVNKDGISDLIIGTSPDSYGSNLKVNWNPGTAYVVFGKKITDTEKPIIADCPANQVLSIGDLIPDYTKSITVTDNCDDKPLIIQTPTAGSVFDGTTVNITLKAVDASGNTSECKFTAALMASASPVIVCPANQELYVNSLLPNYVHFLEDISDDNTPNYELVFTQTPPVGTLFTTDTNVTITVKDKSANESSCTFLVKLKTETFDLDCNTSSIDGEMLNGSNGLILYGEKAGERAGYTTSGAGDINGDGIQDFLIGAKNYGCYVVFGTDAGFPPNINLGQLNGSNGFKIFDDVLSVPAELAYDVSSGGDINGDGIDDLMLSDRQKLNLGKYFAGTVYLIYGKKTPFAAQLPLSSLDGNNGFKIIGNTYDEFLGTAISNIGDFNNDSYSDIAILSANKGSGGVKKAYIIFGSNTNFPASLNIDDLTSSSSFIIEGDVGQTIEAPGDINGDGIVDLIFSGDFTKYRYVVFGTSGLPAKLNTSSLNGTNGFRIENSANTLSTNQYYQVKALGDVNGDSFNDVGIDNYVLFGKSSFPSTFDLKDLNGTNGFKIIINTLEYLHEYSGYGDFNADGMDDIAVVYQNHIYIVYGRNAWNSSINLNTITAADALKIKLPYRTKYSVSYFNDANKDGIDDILIGSSDTKYTFEPNHNPGISYLIFGSKYTDITAPVIANCPSNQVLNSGDLLPDYVNSITVTDNCDSAPKITQTPVAGSVYDGTNTEVVLLAVDASGNTSECKFEISTTADTNPPVIECISDQTVSCGTEIIPDYLNLVTVTDAEDVNPVLTQNPIAGSAFIDGMTIIITAKDVSNNSSICSFKVNASADVTAPVITYIGDQTLSCGSTIPDYTPLVTANDNCDPYPVITQNPPAGSVLTNGMTIAITAKDASDNQSNCSFKVNISADVTAPSINCIADQNLNIGDILPDYRTMITAADNCDSNLIITQVPSLGANVTDGMNVTMNVSDNSGNNTSCTFKINLVKDTQAPVFTCIADQMFDCSVSQVPDYTKMIFVTDNTDPNPVIIQSPLPGTKFSDGMTITIKVSDKSNNISECSFHLFAYPVLVDAGEDIEINEGQFVKLQAVALENGSFSWSPSAGLNNTKVGNPIATPQETTTYTVVFTNKEGCQAEDSVTITVIPLEKDETKYGFSPNGDGINDFWEIDKITDYPENEVLIYSRWGDLVYQTKGYDNSTNVFSGIANKSRNLGASQLPEGTYFFEIRVNQPHHFKKLKGYLVLKR
ncbi:T9SS C-terminal target domain-containing protein [Flavobacterium johnsoniae]|uniref:FG-GAP repeat protein n=1 Tax=Flavobacterium johnsoniae (strain ATCC 17061 / DSM 2064 / JCM 8514 / BCRC 14874 / CCUG 350202 / NBRC 14942 / NCIMB 11054 / UW101) TaxID=376686 RepID=A5FIF6_FLAJ1|nr:T9SS C-terminal target domain-containing protein [Flavobacterium johnsoniae]ABQ05017.1 FG-GAP repeat protein [Flavobacterium johnsoniae UW101]OXG00405.1 T9SS C-terminal target domain-containing protein [Flavobacterium johnsoniae UW101]WQG83185.1 T9SS C-terminal target domain-containing protein [Flavobacterium johnsoniae UW101]SHL89121.1 gliding motility-associated C-terminal domain-containing protein [Flavobacterium johnsoniae]